MIGKLTHNSYSYHQQHSRMLCRIQQSATTIMTMALVALGGAAICSTEAFVWKNHHRHQQIVGLQQCLHRYGTTRNPSASSSSQSPTRLFLSDEPSDTSSDYYYDDDVVTVESESFSPTEAEVMVTSVLDLIPSLVASASEEKRAEINEALLKLEALNPTPEPALSPLLNGVWEL